MLSFPENELSCIKCLIKHNVRFIVIGGKAVKFYNAYRETKDTDVLVYNDSYNSKNLCLALRELIGPHSNIYPEAIENRKLQINLFEHGYKFEIITAIEGLDFNSLHNESTRITVQNVSFAIISKKNLIESKNISGRAIDKEDIEALNRV